MAKNKVTIKFDGDDSALQEALGTLKRIRKLAPEAVNAFLASIDDPAQLISVEDDDNPAAGAGHVFVIFKPSKLFLDFLAAFRTRESFGDVFKADAHGCTS